jgi:hypothetical protein
MRWFLPLGLALLTLIVGGSSAHAEELNKPPTGFKALFNGTDLTNWQGLIETPKRAKLSPDERKATQAKADEDAKAHWSVKDGILVFDGKGQSLQTVKDYGNFELYVDWRIQPKGDSGIYLRGAPQVQIWDDPIGSGGLFNNEKNPSKPLAVADKPVGEWNTFFIRMVGDRVTVKLNDKLVVDDTPLENYWDRSKPLPATGPIELQNHGNILEFRNIYIKELAETSQAQPAVKQVPEELVTLEVAKAPLSQVVRTLAASGTVDMILKDPDGKLADRMVTFISIQQKPLTVAMQILCNSAGLMFKFENGVYYLSAKP